MNEGLFISAYKAVFSSSSLHLPPAGSVLHGSVILYLTHAYVFYLSSYLIVVSIYKLAKATASGPDLEGATVVLLLHLDPRLFWNQPFKAFVVTRLGKKMIYLVYNKLLTIVRLR